MRQRANHRIAVVAMLALLCSSEALRAQSGGEPLEQAKALFREGVALLNAGDPERALEAFLLSRAIVPSGKNTANAAICLDRLGRYDEALELYEELLARFAAELDAQDRENLAPTMAALRQRLASLDISANVEGALIVDSKPRGTLPRTTALRVLPGEHRVRVVKEGYQTFEQVVALQAGQTRALDAKLDPLAGLGALRVERSDAGAAELWIDGKPAGTTPWEGTLSVGPHLVQVIAGDRGSMPEAIDVIERRTLFLRVSTTALGQQVRLTAEPRTAALFVAETPLGRGEWLGRLPVGAHDIRAQAPGYHPGKVTLTSSGDAESQTLVVALTRDRTSVSKPSPWSYAASLDVGMLYAPKLSGGHEPRCAECIGSSAVLGARLEALFAVDHEDGFGAAFAAGYAYGNQDFGRREEIGFESGEVTYLLTQELVFGGPFGRVALGAHPSLPGALQLRGYVGAGLFAATYETAASGAAQLGNDAVPAAVVGVEPITELAPFITAELEIERRFSRFGAFFSLSAWFFPGYGPTFSESRLVVSGSCPPPPETSVGCAPASGRTAHENVHGPFVLFAAAIGARYHF